MTKKGNCTFVEYFAGIGLLRLGLEKAGWQVVFANDFDPAKLQMYSAYFSDAEGLYDLNDIHDLDPHSIPTATLATASFPCIDLSLAGNQSGIDGEHSGAFWGLVHILREQGVSRPPLILLENVPGWLTTNNGGDFRKTVQTLNDLGYCCDVYMLDAIRFVPQSRRRIFLCGTITDRPNGAVHELLARPKLLANSTLKKAVAANSDLRWHILSVPPPPDVSPQGLESIVEEIPLNDSRWWAQSEVDRHLSMMAPTHLERVQDLADRFVVNYRTVYRRMRSGVQRAEVRADNAAGCLRTARGGSSQQILIQVGKGEVRMRRMTPREYARLQGVPDNYPVPDNPIQGLTGFGDAVCVPVVTWVARNVLKPMMALSHPLADHQ